MEIVSLSVDELQRIEPLWKELIAFLHRQSTRFKMEFEQKQFASRIQTYLDKVKDGKYLIDVIVDLESNRDIGYCLSSVTKDSIGEVDSLYVKEEYRDAHMGTILMQRAMDFFEMHHTIKDVLHVSEGNEHALSFYEKYGFQTRYYQLVREK